MVRSNWYLAYTMSRTEKVVDTRLQQIGVESFLPMRTSIRKWSDRVKHIEQPLFSNYLFVRTKEQELPKLSGIKGIVKFISFGKRFVIVPDNDIQLVKYLTTEKLITDNPINDKIIEGQRVLINFSCYQGKEGVIVTRKNKNRACIKIEGIDQYLMVEMPLNYFKVITP